MKKTNKPRVVLDTNVIISAVIIEKSIPHQILEKWQINDFILLASASTFEEINQVLHRANILQNYNLSSEDIDDFLEDLNQSAEYVDTETVDVGKMKIHCRDPKDDMVLSLAIFGQADYLVTGDKDLLDLKNEKEIGNLKIVTQKEFLDQNFQR